MRIAIASDHAAVDLKSELAAWLTGIGHEVSDLGPESGARANCSDYAGSAVHRVPRPRLGGASMSHRNDVAEPELAS